MLFFRKDLIALYALYHQPWSLHQTSRYHVWHSPAPTTSTIVSLGLYMHTSVQHACKQSGSYNCLHSLLGRSDSLARHTPLLQPGHRVAAALAQS